MKLSAKKRFFKFLQDEGIWNLYWYNVLVYNERIKKYNEKIENIKYKYDMYSRKITKPELFLKDAFDWGRSEVFFIEDNFMFWLKVNVKWNCVLENEGYNK